MTIEELEVIDFIQVSKGETLCTLYISDHLEWDDENEKLLLLQEKLNKYLAFLESGEVYEKYPEWKGRKLCICVTSKYEPNEMGLFFLEKATEIVNGAGFEFKWSDSGTIS